jgi:WASH complex subunit 7
MGIAYILAILGQNDHFDALHWFESNKNKYNKDENDLRTQQQAQIDKQKKKDEAANKKRGFFSRSKKPVANNDDDSDEDEASASTLQLTARRLEAHRRETEMLYFSLQGAKIFFADRK